MGSHECVLNLVRKVSVKKEFTEETAINHESFSNNAQISSSVSTAITKQSLSNSSLSCHDCKREKPEKTSFKVSSEEDLENDKENISRRKIRLDSTQLSGSREKNGDEEKIFVLQPPSRLPEGYPTFLNVDGRIADPGGVKRKIPRPANAFMLFANEWRKKLAAENPRESNKDISVRLGILWKNMTKDVKEKYFALAREVDAEHKRKYPDYVYNPKEARLRKAMREQNREFSRRSILQSAIARAGGIGGPSGGVGFLDHQRRFGCVSTTSMPMNSAIESDRAAEPWFQSAHRPKPIHSPRMADWYGSRFGDPIERLQAMGMIHQRSGIDKCKETMRNQVPTNPATGAAANECAGSFAGGGYSPDFSVNREREMRRQENEYAEFAEGQKWHPYQNGASPHQHPRTPHPQMGGILHPNVQNTNSHGLGHGSWGQFCHGMLPHVPNMTRNVGIRGPRHAVFVRDRLPNRHCGFPEESSRLTYTPTKLDMDNVRASYPPAEHQMPRLMESSVDSAMESASTTRPHREEDGGRTPGWEPSTINNGMSLDALVPTSTHQETTISHEKERESRRSSEKFEPKKKSVSKQPLPGFHQAFGSTEIGRFSRSEFFVNMVGESSTGNVEVTDPESSDVSTDRMSETPGATGAVGAAAVAVVSSSSTASRNFEAEVEEAGFDDSNGELVGSTSIGAYCGQPSAPRWHSPHVGAIGSEI